MQAMLMQQQVQQAQQVQQPAMMAAQAPLAATSQVPAAALPAVAMGVSSSQPALELQGQAAALQPLAAPEGIVAAALPETAAAVAPPLAVPADELASPVQLVAARPPEALQPAAAALDAAMASDPAAVAAELPPAGAVPVAGPAQQAQQQQQAGQPTSFMDELLSGLDGMDHQGLLANAVPAGGPGQPIAFAPPQQLAHLAVAMSGPMQPQPAAVAAAPPADTLQPQLGAQVAAGFAAENPAAGILVRTDTGCKEHPPHKHCSLVVPCA